MEALLTDSNIFCITYNIKDQFGGMTASLLKRAKIFGEQKNIPVTVVTFAMNYELRNNVEALKGSKIGDQTEVVNLYEFLSGEKFIPTTIKVYDVKEDGCAVVKQKNKRHYQVFENGKLIMKKDFETYDGKLSSIYFFNDELIIYKKNEYDKNGYLRRTIYYNTSNNKWKQVLFYRLDGTCYLNKHLDYIDNTYIVRKIYHFDKNGQLANEFNSEEAMKKFFLDALTATKQHNFLIVDSKAMFPFIIDYTNTNTNEIYKIYMNHNPQTNFPYTYNSTIRNKMKPIYNQVEKHDAIIVLTNEQKTDLELRFGVLDNCFVILHSFSGHDDIGEFEKRSLNKVISVARFDEQKQNDHLIKAFSKVIKEIPDAVLEFYGFGDKQQEMQKLIDELGLANNVFIKGFTNDVKSVFKTVAFKAMSSKYEGQGLVILESLSYGCPVISYDTKYGPKDMIKDGENGYIVEYNNIDALADSMIKLLKNPEQIKFLSQNCKNSLENYTDEIFMENWINLFKTLVTRRMINNTLNKCILDTRESKWSDFDNKLFSINTKLVIDEKWRTNVNIGTVFYSLVNRKSHENFEIKRDIIIEDKQAHCFISELNLNTISFESNDKKGYWDLYLNLEILGEFKMLRCGSSNHTEKFNSIKSLDGFLVKPYYTKHNNLTLQIQ